MSGALAGVAFSGAVGVINDALPDSTSSLGAAGFELQNDGDLVVSNGAGTTTVDWVSPSETSVAALYEVKVDATSGTFDSGTTGSYLSLGTTRTWSKNSGTVMFNVTIREIATAVQRTMQNVTMSAP